MQSKPEKDDRYKVDIAALSEIRFAGKGKLTESAGLLLCSLCASHDLAITNPQQDNMYASPLTALAPH